MIGFVVEGKQTIQGIIRFAGLTVIVDFLADGNVSSGANQIGD